MNAAASATVVPPPSGVLATPMAQSTLTRSQAFDAGSSAAVNAHSSRSGAAASVFASAASAVAGSELCSRR
eukprot:4141358-Pleurochrysis_carterae.AAC.1